MQLVQKLLQTRSGTVALGGAAAVMAAFVLLLNLNQYRNSVAADSEPVTVLVAKKLIEKGVPGDVVGVRRLFESEKAPRSQVQDGAITDPSTLRGRVAVDRIYPGQQLTVADFGATTQAIGATLTGKHRAMAIPLDSAHGMIGKVEPGDRVDVFASLQPKGTDAVPILKVVVQDALVLDAPATTGAGLGGGNQTSNVVLRVNRDQAATIAYAVDYGKVWVVLRPRAGAPPTKPGVVTERTILGDIKPNKMSAYLRRQNRLVSGS
jgi:Flp pilus assembly protein CpaB